MFRFFRAGNNLVSPDGVVIHGYNSRGNLYIEMRDLPTVKIDRYEHPEEYQHYLALYESAPLLISSLQSEHRRAVRMPHWEWMIKELERFGYQDVTDEIKEGYEPYLYLCTLERPESERQEGPIYIETVEELLTLLEQVNPSQGDMQIWFCEKCQAVSSIGYREGASPTEVIEAMGRDHRKQSKDCSYGAWDLRFLTPKITSRAALSADTTLPDWAKERLAQLLFEKDEETKR